MNQPYKIFTWPVNQHYLFQLAQGDFEIYIPKGQSESFHQQFVDQKNVLETDLSSVKELSLDCILFQDENSYQTSQFEVFSQQQLELPKVYLELNPPKNHPTNAKHFVEDKEVQLIHINHYNALMWDNNGLDVTVIENGVAAADAVFTGEKACGVMVLEENQADERVTGLDIFRQVKEALPLEVIQIGKENITYQNLPEKLKDYRFLFSADRYASPGFAVFQAMMLAMPVVGLATTDLPTIIENEVSGFTDSDITYLIDKMQNLLNQPGLAMQMGAEARKTASERFDIARFLSAWKQVFENAVAQKPLFT